MGNPVSIIRASEEHSQLVSNLAALTFLESHGHSAEPADISHYIAEKYSNEVLKKELQEPANIYHILFYHGLAAGYSKIILDHPYERSEKKNVTKLERIYLLQQYHGKDLAQQLFRFNLDLVKANKQAGIWLYVWKENPRAVNFYRKNGFEIIGSYDFKISAGHSNPNHQMFLALS